MDERERKVVLITGASSGIGRAAAARFVAAGYRVFGTSRTPQQNEAGVEMLPLDVRDDASVSACRDAVLEAAGRIDVLVSNAGEMVFGPVEEVSLEDARSMFETNLWGAARMVNAVLPSMRTQRRGAIVLVGSVAATVAIPMNGFYAASKAALARYAEALRHEALHLGVRISLVEPSDYRTRFWESARIVAPTISDYADLRRRVLDEVRRMIAVAPVPDAVGAAIYEAAESTDPAATIRVGPAARRLPQMRAFMPARIFESGLRRKFGLLPART